MKVKDIAGENLTLLTVESGINNEITGVYCCDLLSMAMSHAPSKSAWVTVIGNINTIAVAVLAEISCIIFAEGVKIDDDALKKAEENGIAVLSTEQPVFAAAYEIYKML